MSIGEMIRSRRKELGLTLEEVGKFVGVGKSTVTKWESGYISNMKRDKIALLAKILKIDPTILISSEDTDGNSNGIELSDREETLITNYRQLNEEGKDKADEYIEDLLGMKRVYRAARSADNHPAEITVLTKEEQERIEKAPRVTSENSDL
ncbi:MAG: helix-turn-helix domain-containing protein [[Eubacterium] saphenum]|nr:helix-turn-helix domain-containing protein [[Eubacterium] saphenum]